MRKTLLTFLATVTITCAGALNAGAQTNTYTDSSAFFSAISASNYTETFNGIAGGNVVTTPTNFSGNGFSFTATTTNTGGNQLYGLTNGGGSDRWLTLLFPRPGLVFTNFSLNVSAIGGNFFATDDQGFYTNTPINVRILLSDSSIFSTNYTPSGATSFLGVTFSTNVSISSLVISNLNNPDPQFPTANNLTIGVVPEPSTYALLGLAAAGFAGYVIRRRRA
jgi:hypothetical protein